MAKFILIIFLILFISCKNENQDEKNHLNDVHYLNVIKKKGKIKALTTYSATSYFLYRGKTMGFEYELLERFADHLGVELEIKVSDNIDSMIFELHNGDIDILAHGLTITSDRIDKVEFTDYLYLTHQVLVQRKPKNWRKMSWSKIQSSLVHDAIELIGDTVSVRKNSSYIKRLANLSNEIGGTIYIDTLSGELSTDEIIKMVVDGEIKYTVADDNIASINASYYPSLNIEVPISFSQRIAWAVKPGADSLKHALNNWLEQLKEDEIYYVIYNKYFKNKHSFRKRVRSELYSLNENKISKYDDIIKKNADKIGWDWRLVASLIYQESRFQQNVSSWAGASGLMQLMPATIEYFGVEDNSDPNQNIRAGTKYLKQLYDDFEDVKDTIQRIKFAMASYNCGFYHVLDARNLAEAKGLDKNKWDDNVEKMILEKSYPKGYNHPVVKYGYVRGIEPYTYIRQIFYRYEHYKQFIDTENNNYSYLR